MNREIPIVIERFGSHRKMHWRYEVSFGLTTFGISAYREGDTIYVQYARSCDKQGETFLVRYSEIANDRMYSAAKILAEKIAKRRKAIVVDRTEIDARKSGSLF